MNIDKELRRKSPPAYDRIQPPRKPKQQLRLSHTIEVEGHGSIANQAEAALAWSAQRKL